jgi:hypothetical protein
MAQGKELGEEEKRGEDIREGRTILIGRRSR